MFLVVGVVEVPPEVHVPQLTSLVFLLPREEVADRVPILMVLGCEAEPRALVFGSQESLDLLICFKVCFNSFQFLMFLTGYAQKS